MTTPTSATRPFPWAPLLVLGFAWFLGVAVELSPAGLLGDIASSLQVRASTVGTLTTFYALGNVLLVLPLTGLAVRFARRPTLVTVMVVFALSNVGVALAPSIPAADVARFVGGAAYGVICSLFPAVAVRIAGRAHAAKAVTVIFTATSLGAALGAPLASLAGNALGWRSIFAAAAVLAGVAGILLSFTVPRFTERADRGMSLLRTARLPGLLPLGLSWSLVMLGHFAVLTYLNAYLQHFGAAAYVTSLALFGLGLTGIVGVVGVGWAARRSVFVSLLASPGLVALAFALLSVGSGSLAVVLAVVAIWGVGIAATIVVYQQAILIAGRRAPETATSIGVLLAQAGFAAGAAVGGVTLNRLGVRLVPLVGVVFVAAGITLAASLRPEVSVAEQHQRTAADLVLQT